MRTKLAVPGKFILPLLFGWSVCALADDAPNLTLKGTLIEPPPCTLNGGNTVQVSFGEQIGTKKVASGIYRQPVSLDMQCDSSTQSWQLTLTWTGNPAGFDTDNATVVSAEQSALGVKLYADGTVLALNTPLKLNGTTLPSLEAVLVQQDGAELDEGTFTAKGTFRAEYQ